jgi:hypothetical protein
MSDRDERAGERHHRIGFSALTDHVPRATHASASGRAPGTLGDEHGSAKHRRFPPKHLSVKIKKAIGINDADVAELVDARDLKTLATCWKA